MSGYCLLLIGNPGSGKSTIIRTLIDKPGEKDRVKSGQSSNGGGLTKRSKKYYDSNNNVYIDTPGIKDMEMDEEKRKQNAARTATNIKELQAGIKDAAGTGKPVKICFVVKDNMGRLAPNDIALVFFVMKNILDINGHNFPHYKYSILINQVPKQKNINNYEKKIFAANKAGLLADLAKQADAPALSPSEIFYQLMDLAALGEDNADFSDEHTTRLKNTIAKMPMVSICEDLKKNLTYTDFHHCEKVAETATCFPACSTSDFKDIHGNVSKKTMADLQYGDLVKTFVNGKIKYEPVIAFTNAQKNIKNHFIEFTFNNGKKLTLTDLHMIMNVDCKTYVRAKDVKVGQELMTVEGNSNSAEKIIVISKENVIKTGAFGPVTLSGNIIVDEIVESCYAEHRLNLFGQEIVFGHSQAHAFMLPYRTFIKYLASANALKKLSVNHDGDKNGTHPYIYQIRKTLIPKQIKAMLY